MIPTPAERRHHQEFLKSSSNFTKSTNHKQQDRMVVEEPDEEDDEFNITKEATSKQNKTNLQDHQLHYYHQIMIGGSRKEHLFCSNNFYQPNLEANEMEEDDEDEDGGLRIEEEDELEDEEGQYFEEDDDYMRLDTIVEEDEESAVCCVGNSRVLQNLNCCDTQSNASSGTSSGKLLEELDCNNENDEQTLTTKTTTTTVPITAGARAKSDGKLAVKTREQPATAADDEKSQQVNSLNKRPLTEQKNCNQLSTTTTKTTTVQGGGLAAASNVIVSNSMRKFATSAVDKQIVSGPEANKNLKEAKSDNNNTTNKQTTSSRTRMPLSCQRTNRIISEHQARQQQALFRTLAERQKLMDELGAKSDLISGNKATKSALSPATKSMSSDSFKRRKRRRRRECQHEEQQSQQQQTRGPRKLSSSEKEQGLPLSAVDLTSMSDRMLDDLLGHVALASSSSSLSSNCSQSSISSEQSSSSNLEDSSCDSNSDSNPSSSLPSSGEENVDEIVEESKSLKRKNQNSQLVRQTLQRQQQISSSDAPNVVGVHEDERTRSSTRSIRQCRETFRRICDNDDDDDDDNNDHELVVDINGANAAANACQNSISPSQQQQRQSMSVRSLDISDQVSESSVSQADSSSFVTSSQDNSQRGLKLTPSRVFCRSRDQAISNGKVRTVDELKATDTQCNAAGNSVEGVLSRMLEALGEIGSDEQEQLNELLEKGFSHLEQLLNCSLAPTARSQPQQHHQQQANLAQKLISNNSTTNNNCTSTTLSKDSDYGSDTQSADCFSQYADNNNRQATNITNNATVNGTSINGSNKWLGLSPNSSNSGNQTSESPSPTSLNTTSSGSNSKEFSQPSTASSQQATNNKTPVGTLSPLAIELSFRLAESLHRLAQQQQARKNSNQQTSAAEIVDGRVSPNEVSSLHSPNMKDNLNNEVESEKERRHSDQQQQLNQNRQPMKSVVMLNCSPSSSPQIGMRVESPAKDVCSSSTLTGEENQRNMTLADEEDLVVSNQLVVKTTAKPQFKTCVNIGGTSKGSTPTREYNDSPQPTAIVISSVKSELNIVSSKKTDDETQVVKVKTESGKQQQQFERRRSMRSSLRRRPSFSGSIGGPRPGSPVPIAVIQNQHQQQQLLTKREESIQQQESSPTKMNPQEHEKHQKKLQKALILAQKYNYSPAKLATSKLSSRLKLTHPNKFNGDQTDGQQRKMAANGSQTLGSSHRFGIQTQIEQDHESKTLPSKSRASTQEPFRVSGQVQLDISYFAKSGTLTVHVMQCSQLAAASRKKATSNVYVKLYLLPDKHKSGKRKSTCHKNELCPKFDEKFTFGPALQLANFDEKILSLSVWHKDRLMGNYFLGELLLPLARVRQQLFASDLCQSTGPLWYPLSERFVPNSMQQHQHQQQQLQQQQKLQTPTSTLQLNKLRTNNNLSSINLVNKEQAELDDKLNELQRKAAMLTSAVTVANLSNKTNLRQAINDQKAMNVVLAPISQQALLESQQSITGRIFVALNFVPDSANQLVTPNNNLSGELRVIIKEAHDIAGFEMPITGGQQRSLPNGPLPNPFCKCYLLDSNGQRLVKQKTNYLKRTKNPRWDFECQFGPMKLGQLASKAIEIHLFNRDSILVSNKNEQLGGIRLCSISQETCSKDEEGICTEREGKLWAQMMAKPNIWVYGELRLRFLRPLIAKQINLENE